ncbi:hypothetical protein REPUB_Repub12eG0032000 [Reevesia pubescens]
MDVSGLLCQRVHMFSTFYVYILVGRKCIWLAWPTILMRLLKSCQLALQLNHLLQIEQQEKRKKVVTVNSRPNHLKMEHTMEPV